MWSITPCGNKQRFWGFHKTPQFSFQLSSMTAFSKQTPGFPVLSCKCLNSVGLIFKKILWSASFSSEAGLKNVAKPEHLVLTSLRCPFYPKSNWLPMTNVAMNIFDGHTFHIQQPQSLVSWTTDCFTSPLYVALNGCWRNLHFQSSSSGEVSLLCLAGGLLQLCNKLAICTNSHVLPNNIILKCEEGTMPPIKCARLHVH